MLSSIMSVLAHPSLPPALSPPLKWAGGKRWLVPILRHWWSHFPDHRLVEPFCGGLAVALGLQPQRALLNDANVHLINFYRQIQQGFTPDATWINDRTYYDEQRKRFNTLIQAGDVLSLEGARLFYYLNRSGFNGLCRFNRQGLFNVPFGRYVRIRYERDWQACQQALASWQLTCGDYEAVAVESADAIYADPPYDVPFVQYSPDGFGWEQQQALAQWLAAQTVPLLVSNQATPRILALYQDLGFTVQTLLAPRRIACTGDRTDALEMLAWRNGPSAVWITP